VKQVERAPTKTRSRLTPSFLKGDAERNTRLQTVRNVGELHLRGDAEKPGQLKSEGFERLVPI